MNNKLGFNITSHLHLVEYINKTHKYTHTYCLSVCVSLSLPLPLSLPYSGDSGAITRLNSSLVLNPLSILSSKHQLPLFACLIVYFFIYLLAVLNFLPHIACCHGNLPSSQISLHNFSLHWNGLSGLMEPFQMNSEAPCIALHGYAADLPCMCLCVSYRVELPVLVFCFFTY